MRLVIDDTTRFFSVVGAPYIPESHLDNRCAEHDLHARRDDDPEATFVPWPPPPGGGHKPAVKEPAVNLIKTAAKKLTLNLATRTSTLV
ncbi:MAG: hypothetical protein K2Z80_19630 [Xanthobacteraceae bacterium]|nr:hypothetical protein [Xanthobacteraceae bacterium]